MPTWARGTRTLLSDVPAPPKSQQNKAFHVSRWQPSKARLALSPARTLCLGGGAAVNGPCRGGVLVDGLSCRGCRTLSRNRGGPPPEALALGHRTRQERTRDDGDDGRYSPASFATDTEMHAGWLNAGTAERQPDSEHVREQLTEQRRVLLSSD